MSGPHGLEYNQVAGRSGVEPGGSGVRPRNRASKHLIHNSVQHTEAEPSAYLPDFALAPLTRFGRFLSFYYYLLAGVCGFEPLSVGQSTGLRLPG